MAIRCEYKGASKLKISSQHASHAHAQRMIPVNPQFCLYTTSWGICKGNSGNRDPRGRLLEAVGYAVGNSTPLGVSASASGLWLLLRALAYTAADE